MERQQRQKSPYRIFRPTYTEKVGGKRRRSPTYHIAFRDHLKRRQSFAGETTERSTRIVAEKLLELVNCRRGGEGISDPLRKWIDSRSEKELARLQAMDLLTSTAENAGVTLAEHLDGRRDDAGNVTRPGWRQDLEARGVTGEHVRTVTSRVETLLTGCALFQWRDLIQPDVETRITVWLGKQREKGKINGRTFNYYVRDLRSFCRWLGKRLDRPAPLADLRGVDNAEADAEGRRPLSTAEMRLLLAAAAAGPVICGLTGDERALLYRFAFETGLRPNQIRNLKVSDFDLDSDPATVKTHARYVKRRRAHVQVLRAALAADLRERFKTRMPAAAALTLPAAGHMAEMLRADLAAARTAWLEAKGISDKEREQRHRSDFLADANHEGARAVFYSTRHGHGTALADAGVPEKDIAASMHHASRTTTTRYLHSDRKSRGAAVAVLPDLPYPAAAAATGTDGPAEKTDPEALRIACATGRSSVDSGGESREAAAAAEQQEFP